MKDFIDELEKQLKNDARLYGIKIDTYGDKYALPEDVPYVNVVPRAKRRARQFVIGSSILYDASFEIELHCWESSMDDIRDAFGRCESLAERVLDTLADITSTVLGVHHHESEIESFDGGEYESNYYYLAVVVLKASKDESYT